MVEEAVFLLNNLAFQEVSVPDQQVSEAENRLMSRIGEAPVGKKGAAVPMRRWMAVAASVVLLVLAGLGLRKLYTRPSIATQYGEISRSVLPDGTEITLNAHSRIEYGKQWSSGKDREVWLTGEAFFHVKKTPEHDRFIVHTDHFDVIVTGTQFNVVNHANEAGVVLKEGSVTVHGTNGQDLKMLPGDLVDLKGGELVKQTVNPEDIIAWTDNKMNFDNTPISEVIKMIQEHYGVKVTVSDPSLLTHTLIGIFPNDNLNVLLKALEATKEFKVSRDGDNVVIQSPF